MKVFIIITEYTQWYFHIQPERISFFKNHISQVKHPRSQFRMCSKANQHIYSYHIKVNNACTL